MRTRTAFAGFHRPFNRALTGGDLLAQWGQITGTLSNQSDLYALLTSIQSQVTALGAIGTEHDGGSGSTVSVDFSVNSAWKAILTAAVVTVNLSNLVIGQGYFLRLTQDVVGLRAVTWPDNLIWSGNTVPSPSNRNQVDLYNFYTDGTFIYGSYVQGYPNPNAFDPTTSIPNNVLWFDCNDTTTLNGGGGITNLSLVSVQADKSGNGHDATQVTNSLRPQFVTNQANGLAVVRYTSKTMILPSDLILATASHAFSLILVIRFNTFSGLLNGGFFTMNASSAHPFSLGVNGSGDIIGAGVTAQWLSLVWPTGTQLSDGNFHTINFQYNGAGIGSAANYLLQVDATTYTPTTTTPGTSLVGTFIGSQDGILETSYMMKADLAQLFFYSAAVTGTDMTNLRDFINLIYGI